MQGRVVQTRPHCEGSTCAESPHRSSWHFSALPRSARETPRIQVVPHAVAPRVDIIIDGKPFTSYIFERSQKKPSLYPLRTAKGTIVTRGYPLDPHPGERSDHPHHVGLWFNYGDVNGLDFWNNSDAIPAARADEMGTIVHQRVIEAVSGKDKGELNVEMDWVDVQGHAPAQGEHPLRLPGRRHDPRRRSHHPAGRAEGSGRARRQQGRRAGHPRGAGARTAVEVAPTSSSTPTTSPRPRAVNNEGVTGNYIGSDGKTGDAVWGTRGPWTMLQGTVGSEAVTVAILDHPDNPGLPHLLACARLRAVRREQPGPEGVRSEAGGSEAHDCRPAAR